MDDKLDWSPNTDALYRKGQSRLFFLRSLRSFDVCVEIMTMFYQMVVASALFFAAVCWGGSLTDKNTKRLDKLVKKAGSVLGRRLDPLTSVVERGTKQTGSYYGQQQTPSPQSTGATKKHLQQSAPLTAAEQKDSGDRSKP
ncbi:DUF1891 domain-containing protein [Enterococcus faecium]